MTIDQLILNEREAKRIGNILGRMNDLFSPTEVVRTAKLGLSAEVVELHSNAVQEAKKSLDTSLSSFKLIQAGEYDAIAKEWQNDPGVILIIARIAHGLSQAGLASKLGMKEQQLQRYEAERYRSISLQNFRRISKALGVDIRASLKGNLDKWLSGLSNPERQSLPEQQLNTIITHARKYHWFESTSDEAADRKIVVDFISENQEKFASPGLLRTGLASVDLKNDPLLLAWRARVVARAEMLISQLDVVFDFLDISWLREFVQLSALGHGPTEAIRVAASKGIVIIVERQLPGLKLDGAAFLINGTPVIGLTVRNDRIDNFWYTLMHELGHVFLHQQSGLTNGFFDEELESVKNDVLEQQADRFASSMLIPSERWRIASARISRAPEPIEQFAKQLGIHPAIVFGRLRKERNDYRIFSDKIGNGEITAQLYPNSGG